MSVTFEVSEVQTSISFIIHPLKSLQALAASAMDSLQWRHAGLGVLQAYLYEGTEEEMRLHVWHPELKKAGMRDHGDIHDHRFDMTSYVLLGKVLQEEYGMSCNPLGAWRCHTVTHARKAEKSTGTFHEAHDDKAERCNVTLAHTAVIPEGFLYTFPKRSFHRSDVEELTVTLVAKSNQDAIPARVLSRLDSPIVHAFTDTLPREEFQKYLDMAKSALFQKAKAAL